MTDEQPQLGFDLDARDAVLDAHRRRDLIRWLEYELYLWATWLRRGKAVPTEADLTPVSANVARRVLEAYAFELEDGRILGGLFPPSRWRQVGEATSDTGVCHARRIRTFVPLPEGIDYFEALQAEKSTRPSPPAWLGPRRTIIPTTDRR